MIFRARRISHPFKAKPSSPRRRQVTRTIIAALDICGTVRIGRDARKIAFRALKAPIDRGPTRISIPAVMLTLKLAFGFHELAAGLHVLTTDVLDTVAV